MDKVKVIFRKNKNNDVLFIDGNCRLNRKLITMI